MNTNMKGEKMIISGVSVSSVAFLLKVFWSFAASSPEQLHFNF